MFRSMMAIHVLGTLSSGTASAYSRPVFASIDIEECVFVKHSAA
jgi:hypothetical protein